jgi:hypothetical protein
MPSQAFSILKHEQFSQLSRTKRSFPTFKLFALSNDQIENYIQKVSPVEFSQIFVEAKIKSFPQVILSFHYSASGIGVARWR